ncbi:rRNA cytosine-C5-methyltransferase [Mumia sp. zg.B17]|uniref:RsmB/NOP family class I SAM-dependent RNA methyltransferase n=1 Tax=Mumia sp. zg.B17 TaxID=2855446 RepID=UPI001C6F040B|nr:transcription antitermination factor NusB [Mumia sp. zg.B17]MBW9206017.1 rRNA cytosine-C5-methyltransferase [Mumia sp. zg.B17]
MAERRDRPQTRQRVDPTRRVAWEVLRAVEEQDAYVNLLLPGLLRENAITGRDAAFTTELTHGTIRRSRTYDAVLDRLAPKGIDAPVRDVLRLGVHQLLAMRVPSHAAVSTSVDLTRAVIGHRPASFVNAVLRKVAAADLDTWVSRVAPPYDDDPVGHLAVVHAHPRWVVEAFRDALGDAAPEELAALLAADNAPPRVTLVARPGLAEPEDLEGLEGEAGEWSPYAFRLAGGDPGAVPAVREGRIGVQDEGSQLVAIAAASFAVDGADEHWLDLCAGPGGKAALLGAIAGGRDAHVLANEVTPHRAELVRSAVRLLDHVDVSVEDGRTLETGTAYDRVVVDAPCTGLGALRRRPEARWRRQQSDLDDLTVLQRDLLNHAVDLARPGGVVTYATCSPHRRETREVVEAVLAARDDVELVDATSVLAGVPHLERSEPYVQLWPHLHGTDAMFVAALRRTR